MSLSPLKDDAVATFAAPVEQAHFSKKVPSELKDLEELLSSAEAQHDQQVGVEHGLQNPSAAGELKAKKMGGTAASGTQGVDPTLISAKLDQTQPVSFSTASDTSASDAVDAAACAEDINVIGQDAHGVLAQAKTKAWPTAKFDETLQSADPRMLRRVAVRQFSNLTWDTRTMTEPQEGVARNYSFLVTTFSPDGGIGRLRRSFRLTLLSREAQGAFDLDAVCFHIADAHADHEQPRSERNRRGDSQPRTLDPQRL